MLHDFPAFALFFHIIVKMSEGTFCRVEVHMVLYTCIASHFEPLGAPIAQSGECRTLDRKVPGLILIRGAVLCP